MTDFQWKVGELDPVGGTSIWLFVQTSFDTELIELMMDITPYSQEERIKILNRILWDNPDLKTYYEKMLSEGKDILKKYDLELKDFSIEELKYDSIRRHVSFLDNAVSLDLISLKNHFLSLAIEENTTFSPYSFTTHDLSVDNRFASIIEGVLQIQINICKFLKNEVSQKSPIVNYTLQDSQVQEKSSIKNEKFLIWHEDKLNMSDFVEEFYNKGWLKSELNNTFLSIYQIICKRIHRSSLRLSDFDYSSPHSEDSIEWLGSRKIFVSRFSELITKKVLTLGSITDRDPIVTELRKIFIIRPVKGKSKFISEGTLKWNFKEYESDPEGFDLHHF